MTEEYLQPHSIYMMAESNQGDRKKTRESRQVI